MSGENNGINFEVLETRPAESQLTGPHVLLVPFETVDVPFLVVVRSSLLSETPSHPVSVKIDARA